MSVRSVLVGFVVLVAAAGCVPSPGPGDVTLLEVRDDVVGLRPVRLDALRPVGDDVVEAEFRAGAQPCVAVGRVDVAETEDDVAVTVWVGTPSDQVGTVCVQIVQRYAVRAALDAPVGDRALVDGSLQLT